MLWALAPGLRRQSSHFVPSPFLVCSLGPQWKAPALGGQRKKTTHWMDKRRAQAPPPPLEPAKKIRIGNGQTSTRKNGGRVGPPAPLGKKRLGLSLENHLHIHGISRGKQLLTGQGGQSPDRGKKQSKCKRIDHFRSGGLAHGKNAG